MNDKARPRLVKRAKTKLRRKRPFSPDVALLNLRQMKLDVQLNTMMFIIACLAISRSKREFVDRLDTAYRTMHDSRRSSLRRRWCLQVLDDFQDYVESGDS